MSDADRNRLICEGLGIPAEVRHKSFCSIWQPLDDPKCDCRAGVTYPDLATSEGFWVLWDALGNKPHPPWPEVWRTISGSCAKVDGRTIFNAATPWAALFEAAWALMQKEAGNG
jgi:hypothetical protein